MRFSAIRWPLDVARSARSAPDLSVSSVRVSDTVRTAIASGRNSRSSVLIERFRGGLRVESRLHGQVVRHQHGVLSAAVVRGPLAGLAVAELRVELARAGIAFAQLETHEKDAGRARGRL